MYFPTPMSVCVVPSSRTRPLSMSKVSTRSSSAATSRSRRLKPAAIVPWRTAEVAGTSEACGDSPSSMRSMLLRAYPLSDRKSTCGASAEPVTST